MVIIGVNSSHNSTACLLIDGQIIACVSEERLVRIKNYWGMPYLAIKECMDLAGLKTKDIDYLVLNFLDPKIHTNFRIFNAKGSKKTAQFSRILLFAKEQLLTKIPVAKYIYDYSLDTFYRLFINHKMDQQSKNDIEKNLHIPSSKIQKIDHHTSHALSAYYSSSFPKDKPVLMLTLDSSGDGECATVSIRIGDKITRIAKTSAGASLSDLYMYTTIYLGMKPVEHEQKVMGLAPYSDRKYFQPILNRLRKLVWVNEDLTFNTKIHSQMFYKILPQLFAGERFDNVAAAIQTFTEELVCEWVVKAVNKTRVSDVVCAGGTFMNVKVNQKVLALKEVNKLFVMPSAADESTAIGAAYWGYQIQKTNNPSLPGIKPLTHLYLGREFSKSYIEKVLKSSKYKKLTVLKPANLEKQVATLLAKGEIIARFSGPSEWGARALGNRSILAHPAKLEIVTKINRQIKSRDFWMPFAPTILKEDADKYFVNKKRIIAPYMIITFDSTEAGKEYLKAASHQYDFTLRPQVIYKEWNPEYYKLIEEFRKQTGIGALLNTSFNLHGEPIVYSPEDALYVFENSGLKYLALGQYLIRK